MLPSLIRFVPEGKIFLKEDKDSKITSFFSKISLNNQKTIFSVTILAILLSLIGISRLEVENSFINYFSKKTEIYQGMKLIDEKLGGTTPLEVILKFPKKDIQKRRMMMNLMIGTMITKMMKSIGSLKIRLIQFHRFIII